jgi:hypothetical protein
MMPDERGPVLVEQVMPLTPVIDQLPAPLGVAPPVTPLTVAVKVKLEPSAMVEAEVVTTTVGVILVNESEKVALGPAVV